MKWLSGFMITTLFVVCADAQIALQPITLKEALNQKYDELGIDQNESKVIVVDLAVQKTVNTPISNGIYRIEIRNRVPAKYYETTIDLVKNTYPAIELPDIVFSQTPGGLKSLIPGCQEFEEKLTDATKTVDEKTFANHMSWLREHLSAYMAVPGCSNLNAYNNLIRNSFTINGPIEVKRGRTLTISVKNDTTNWKHVFKTPLPGSFNVTYGYTLPINGLRSSSTRHREYFTNEIVVDSTKKYIVASGPSDDVLSIIPSVMISYSGDTGWSRYVSPAVGIGLSQRMINLGVSTTFKDTIVLSGGASVVSGDRLRRYAVGDTLNTAIDSKELVRSAMTLFPFVSISVRFSRNPFKADDETETEQESSTDESRSDNSSLDNKSGSDGNPIIS